METFEELRKKKSLLQKLFPVFKNLKTCTELYYGERQYLYSFIQPPLNFNQFNKKNYKLDFILDLLSVIPKLYPNCIVVIYTEDESKFVEYKKNSLLIIINVNNLRYKS